jgi:ribonuclease HI
VIIQTYAARKDLKKTPLENSDLVLFTDGSSITEQGVHKAGCAVVTIGATTESSLLPPNTSTQLVELIALAQALELS